MARIRSTTYARSLCGTEPKVKFYSFTRAAVTDADDLPAARERATRNRAGSKKDRDFNGFWAFSASPAGIARTGLPLDRLGGSFGPRGAGSVFSFDIQGSRAQGRAFIEALKIFSHLANVGDCRSLVIHPASTTHFRMSDEALSGAGIGPGTIRLSIGLEDPDDLIDDLKKALRVAEKAGA
mgnify:CR=1 FL=1